MFQAFYGMDFNPFSKEVDIKYHFKSNDFTQASNRFEYLKQAKGIALIAGEPGCGKTFCLKCFVSSLNRNLFKTVYIPSDHPYGKGVLYDPVRPTGHHTRLQESGIIQTNPGVYYDLCQ